MFIAERELRKVIEYSLSTNFDVSSCSTKTANSIDVQNQYMLAVRHYKNVLKVF